MFHIPVSEGISILEPYYDGGDSYSDNYKYSRLSNYYVDPKNSTSQIWCGWEIKIPVGKKVVLSRKCDISMKYYDTLRIFLSASENVSIKLFGREKRIIDTCGEGGFNIIRGKVYDEKLYEIKYIFENKGDMPETVILFYLGAENTEIEENKSFDFPPVWEGCFEENAEIGLFSNILISDKDAGKLKEKMSDITFCDEYTKTKQFAMSLVNSTPEKHVRNMLCNGFRKDIPLVEEACALAFVGFVEKDKNMIRLACRYALSIACCNHWCSDLMETVPGVTWYHRSFNERTICMTLAYVMEFAGGFLTWHGRNIIYNAMIMKGLPRFEADFMTMEYIRHMNQGIAFETGYIITLLTLSQRFPRYEKRIQEAEQDLFEMFSNCTCQDGGMLEGAEYWQYTMLGFLTSAFLLARYRGVGIREYLGSMIEKTSEFGLAVLNPNGFMREIGDCQKGKRYLDIISSTMAYITEDKRWYDVIQYSVENRDKYNRYGTEENRIFQYIMCNTIGSLKYRNSKNTNFSFFPDTGYIILKRGATEFLGISGKSYSHCHCDKGSFTIYKDGIPVIIDRGMCPYDKSGGTLMSEAQMHNLLVPETENGVLNQVREPGAESVIIKAEYTNRKFIWCTDNTQVWDRNVVVKNIRTVTSDTEDVFFIIDEFEFTSPLKTIFRLNIYDSKYLKAEAVNWVPEKEECLEYGTDSEGNTVYQLRMCSKKSTSIKLITKITLREV